MRKDYKLEKRKYVIFGFLVIVATIFVIRLYNLQINDEQYKQSADTNAFLKKTIYPSRGLMYDRNGELVVLNQPAYDVMLIPRDVKDFDTLDFCNTLHITKEQLIERLTNMKDRRRNPGYSQFTPQRLIANLSAEDYGRLQEKLYRFPGFFIQNRILRQYTYPIAANLLGNIREVSQRDIDRDDYYSPGDYTGDNGIEKSYEPFLRGEKGKEILIRDAKGQIQGRYENGAHDIPPIAGKNLTLSIDIKLQAYAESLMVGKRGAVVAIEPETGEILCMVSMPSYDPGLLVGRDRGKNYQMLVNDETWPLFDRAIMGTYPPGSTFKPTQGLIFLEEGVIDRDNTRYPCSHGYLNGGLRVGCHGHPSPLPLLPALQTSCNGYFCWGFYYMMGSRSKYGNPANAFEVWKKHLVSMGYGYKLGIDIPGEKRGFIPNAAYYDKFYGQGHWGGNTIISVAIGQGEILATPLQIANLSATIANRGWFKTPHVVKAIEDTIIADSLVKKRYPTIASHWYDDVAQGMRMAVQGGTCTKAQFGGIEVCGKTGTAQNPHGKDHSAFMGFAPLHEPKIAVAVYVENGGWGATFGVPIGSLVMEKYLKGEIEPGRKYLEDHMLNTTISYAPPKPKPAKAAADTTKTQANKEAKAQTKKEATTASASTKTGTAQVSQKKATPSNRTAYIYPKR